MAEVGSIPKIVIGNTYNGDFRFIMHEYGVPKTFNTVEDAKLHMKASELDKPHSTWKVMMLLEVP